MCLILTTLLALLELIAYTDAIPYLKHPWQHESVSKDLGQLSLSYQHCHIHIMLYDTEVSLHGIRTPYTVSQRGIKFALFKIGVLTIPKLRNMINPCQAAFQVFIPRDGQSIEYQAMRLHEGKLAWYKLKQRYSFVLLDYPTRLRGDMHIYYYGGNLAIVLKYEGNKKNETGAYGSLECATVYCDHCLQPEQMVTCSSISHCLKLVGQAHEEMAQGGSLAKWFFYAQRSASDNAGREKPFNYYCSRPEHAKARQCTVSLKDAMFNYLAGSLNISVSGQRIARGAAVPEISWSGDHFTVEEHAVEDLLPLNVYPMLSPTESTSGLKFITADGVYSADLALSIYSQPFDLAIWGAALGLFFVLLVMIALTFKAEDDKVNVCKTIGWGFFWAYSILLDQVDFPVIRKARAGARLLIGSFLVISLVLAFVLNNSYRAVLNVDYITGDELICPRDRLDQLVNLTTLYIPTGACVWKHLIELKPHGPLFSGKDVELLTFTTGYFCGASQRWSHCKEPIDGILCTLHEEKAVTTLQVGTHHENCKRSVDSFLGRTEDRKTPGFEHCWDPRLRLLWRLNRIFKYFPLAELETYIKGQVSQPGTALVVNERMFPVVWNKFEKAMQEDRNLKFGHNYFDDSDTTLVKKRTRLFVASGMPQAHTRLVTGRMHNLLGSGTWEFWISLETQRMKEHRFEKAPLSAVTPISMKHDSVYVLLIITGALGGLSAVSFFTSLGLVWVHKVVVWFKVRKCSCTPGSVRRVFSSKVVLWFRGRKRGSVSPALLISVASYWLRENLSLKRAPLPDINQPLPPLRL